MDTVKNIAAATSDNVSSSGDTYQWAYWLGGLLAAGVIALGLLKRRNAEQNVLKQKLKKGKIDFDGVINSAFHAQEMYDLLKKKCHPDRFSTQPEQVGKATEIFALIVKNKYDYKALCQLKERAERELNIHF